MRLVRSLVVIAFVLMSAQVVCAADGWIPFDGAAGEAATVSVVESDASHVVLRIDVPGLSAESVETSGGKFTRLTLDGAGSASVVGEALLPVVREFIEIPHGTDPVLTVAHSDYRRVALADLGVTHALLPVQAPVEKIPGALESARFEMSAAYYDSDVFSPSSAASLGEVQTMRGHRFVQLEVSPVRYNPARGEVEYATSIEVTVEFPGADLAETRRVHDRYSNGRFAKLASDTFINHAVFTTRYTTPLPIGYLIVCYDSFTDEIAPLAAWKEQKGYNTTVVSTADIPGGNTKENIKSYIQDAYDNWSVPPTFVLLVGDTPQISHWVGTQSNSPSTDLYYTTMDGSSDWLPDIWIGRFSCSNASQVTNLVNKTVDYETWNLTSGTDWIKKAVFMASEDNYTVTEGTHDYVIRQYLDPAGYYSQRLYMHTYNATTAQVSAAFNDGRSLGIYSGHGAITYWADGPVF
ncbi:MAG TPA: C25 family cysteine peptidase, partial [bacterium]|nr:C25 family cysteine peptidase [bacterium]